MTLFHVTPVRGIIVAVSSPGGFLSGGVIGKDGRIPWSYPGDLRRFKRVTMGTTIVMGRLTWESIGRALPGRRNVVLTSRPIVVPHGVDVFPSMPAALASADGPVWFIGGARVYAEALAHANVIDATFVPDMISSCDAVRFPDVSAEWTPGTMLTHEDDDRLLRREFRRLP